MKTKEEIVANWLPRYTKRNLEDFGEYILLTNFNKYVEIFANQFNVPILGRDANMISASAEGITMINFGMGSPNAAIIMDLLGAIQPKACLFLGKMWWYRQEKSAWRFDSSYCSYPWGGNFQRLFSSRSSCITCIYVAACRFFIHP